MIQEASKRSLRKKIKQAGVIGFIFGFFMGIVFMSYIVGIK